MDETSMVERVAEALTKAFDSMGRVFDAGQAEDLARSAIEAMREPTAAMLKAEAANAYDLVEQGRVYDEYDSDPAELAAGAQARIWQAMIDAALSQAIGNKESGDAHARISR